MLALAEVLTNIASPCHDQGENMCMNARSYLESDSEKSSESDLPIGSPVSLIKLCLESVSWLLSFVNFRLCFQSSERGDDDNEPLYHGPRTSSRGVGTRGRRGRRRGRGRGRSSGRMRARSRSRSKERESRGRRSISRARRGRGRGRRLVQKEGVEERLANHEQLIQVFSVSFTRTITYTTRKYPQISL